MAAVGPATVKLSGWVLAAEPAGLKIALLPMAGLNVPVPGNVTEFWMVLQAPVVVNPVQAPAVVGPARNSPPARRAQTYVPVLFRLTAESNVWDMVMVNTCVSLALAAAEPQSGTAGMNCTPINENLSWPTLSATLSLAVAPGAFLTLYDR